MKEKLMTRPDSFTANFAQAIYQRCAESQLAIIGSSSMVGSIASNTLALRTVTGGISPRLVVLSALSTIYASLKDVGCQDIRTGMNTKRCAMNVSSFQRYTSQHSLT